MKKIYLDTNMLLSQAQFKVDLISEIDRIADFPYKIFLLEGTIEELKKIKQEGRGKTKDAAKLALMIVDRKLKEKSLNITPFSKSISVDDILVTLADKDTIIATQDKALKKRVRNKGGAIIVLKNKKYLGFA